MATNDVNFIQNPSPNDGPHNDGHKSHAGAFAGIAAALALALGGDVYLLSQNNHLNQEVADMRDSTAKQMAKLDAATATAQEESRQRLEALQASLNTSITSTGQSSTVALKRLRAEAQKQADELAQKLAAANQANEQVNGELSQLKTATTSKFDEFSTDVNGVKTDVNGVKEQVATAKTAIDQQTAELKRVMGDMGVMSGLIATNSKDLVHLRELGDRNYVEFTLAKNEKTKKVGDMVLTFKKADVKNNRYTIEVQADDKKVEKKDRTINEPVQIYISGNRQPNEIVVNQVGKDQLKGYVALPKVTTISQR